MTEPTNLQLAARRLAVELAVIVAGVLIALAIDEWRQKVLNASLEREYHAQLISDLQAMDQAVRAVEEYNSRSIDAVEALLTAFESEEEADATQIADLIEQSLRFDNPVPILGTIDALIATGDLRLIRDSDLRSQLTEYQSAMRDYFLTPLYKWEERHYDLVSRIYTIALNYGIMPNGRIGFAAKSIQPDLNSFLVDRQAYAALLELAFVKAALASYRKRAQDNSVTLMRAIQGHKGSEN